MTLFNAACHIVEGNLKGGSTRSTETRGLITGCQNAVRKRMKSRKDESFVSESICMRHGLDLPVLKK